MIPLLSKLLLILETRIDLYLKKRIVEITHKNPINGCVTQFAS